MKILLSIPLSPYSGYGRDGIGLSRALTNAGVDVYLDPKEVQAPLPEDVRDLLGKTPQAPFDVIIQHVDPMTMEALETTKQSTSLLIGWTMWEWSDLSNAKNRSKFKERYKHFDAMLAYDENTKSALSKYYKGPIFVLQGGFSPEGFEYIEREWHDTFRFIQIGVLSPRKNPMASVQAFQIAREQDEDFRKHARLALKTSVPGLHSKMQDLFVDVEDGVEVPKMRIFYGMWPDELVKEFYASANVLLAPSRGEGKNLPALEFLATGGPVIATNWGGHLQWLSEDYAYPIDYTLTPDDPYRPTALSAEVDTEHMASLMLQAFRDRGDAKQRGAVASRVIPHHFSWDAVVKRLFLTIAQMPGGDRVFEKYVIAQREEDDDE